ncbi:hypothetical protein B9Z19DRAFT_1137665 [Tuber borchii]|uniref:Uncharacterized protein n=1 Tax=Tuber borchii TaxID=42251 RepID=A0A2T6ZA99_TUBBO|nr:hypothetical protein B9Z19DRAFT_1137665 [Tuber borchii]
MVKRGSSTFSAFSVARSGVVLSKSVEKCLALEAEVSRLRHHVSVLSRRLHHCEKERKVFCGAAFVAPRSDSPFSGNDDFLPPPADEEVAGASVVVCLPSPEGMAGGVVAPSVAISVAASVASSEASSGLSALSFTRGKLGNTGRIRWYSKGGTVIGEVDDDDDLIMGSAEPVAGPVDAAALRSDIYRRNVLCRDREAERRNRELVRMTARDGLDTPPPVEEGPSAVSIHMCPVSPGGVNGIIVRCPCGAEFERKRLGAHLRGVVRKGIIVGGCSEGWVISEGGQFVAAWDVDLNCLVEGCPAGGASFTGMAGALMGG